MQIHDDGLQPYSTMAGKLDSKLLQALKAQGFEYMTPVQQRILNELPDWRSDCLVQAKTGTGKTIAFLLPTLHCLLSGREAAPRGQVAVLIITPTRELAQQIAKSCNELTSQFKHPPECHTAVGGTARKSALSRFLDGNPSVLVATPGRLKDYLDEPEAARKLGNIRTLILDEADTMLEAGFLADVKHILRSLPPKSTGWQGMCFSATVPPKVRGVVSVVLKPGYKSISAVEGNETPTHERVPQYHVVMPSVVDTFTTLTSLLQYETKNNKKIIVFGFTANLVALIYDVFSQGLTSLPVFEIHSKLTQPARTKTTSQFKETESGILFASDVVGRGMDFPNVDLVVQVGLPSSPDQYVHRVGRTARAGNDGRAILLITEPEFFFVNVNPKLPIKRHPDTDLITKSASSCAEPVMECMYKVDEKSKQRAYSSYIGYFAGSSLMKKLGLDRPGLVRLANDLAIRGMACPEPPPMDPKTVGKMGLKGVPGFVYMTSDQKANKGRPSPKPKSDMPPFSSKPGSDDWAGAAALGHPKPKPNVPGGGNRGFGADRNRHRGGRGRKQGP